MLKELRAGGGGGWGAGEEGHQRNLLFLCCFMAVSSQSPMGQAQRGKRAEALRELEGGVRAGSCQGKALAGREFWPIGTHLMLLDCCGQGQGLPCPS